LFKADSDFKLDRQIGGVVKSSFLLSGVVPFQVGAHFLETVVRLFDDTYKHPGEGKECDNLVAVVAHLYNFQVVHSLLIFDILRRLLAVFGEKDIELLLFVLRNVGFSLRKDDPLALKELIAEAQRMAAEVGKKFQDQTRLTSSHVPPLPTCVTSATSAAGSPHTFSPPCYEQTTQTATTNNNASSSARLHRPRQLFVPLKEPRWERLLFARELVKFPLIGFDTFFLFPFSQITFQFSLWDKFRELSNLPARTFNNLIQLVTLFLQKKCFSLSLLKVIEFGELDKAKVRFLRQVLTRLLTDTEPEDVIGIFSRISGIPQLRMLREGLKLFISHFLLKSAAPQDAALTERARIATQAMEAKEAKVKL
ncbi:nucleolar MIF4G domain-containing protein 1-like, partial [Hippocampus comes]|uniref:nucleolar MIF4G domain-containing protein 1-like n=1 Tax=Hippocampus comes TaxID=109280 RepID=UPI00094E898E